MSERRIAWRATATVAAALAMAGLSAATVHAGPEPTLDPASVPKFVEPLVIPPAYAPTGGGKDAAQYFIAARQFQQQVLPTGYPMTTVFGYGRQGDPLPGEKKNQASSFSWPGRTIETRTNETVRVLWVNELMDAKRGYLPHLLPIDQNLHWANPGGMTPDSMGMSADPYTGPVPLVTHLHGAHVADHSDGYPEAWYLPHAKDIPDGFFTQGTHYSSVHAAPPGAAWYEYSNDQRAAGLWFHDHSLGMTRVNVYAGLAAFYFIRDAQEDGLNLPGPAPRPGDKAGTKYYEIPLLIQDRSFDEDGSLWYPDSREFFDGFAGPYLPNMGMDPGMDPEMDPGMGSDVPPIWNPEFFGNTMTVNGRTWPYLNVEPRLYRFRLLNGCGSRFLLLKMGNGLPFVQIGSDGGLLPTPAVVEELLLGPGERADVIVDFSGCAVNDTFTLLNLGPDEPFGGLPVETPADEETTGQVMQFRVVPLTNQGRPGQIPTGPLAFPAMPPATVTRDVTLNEAMSMIMAPPPDDPEGEPESIGPIAAFLGSGADGPLSWMAPVTENPVVDTTEIWRIINLTADAHPIHLHLVQFQILDRTPFDADAYMAAQEAYLEEKMTNPEAVPPDPTDFVTGPAEAPPANEAGLKDTVVSPPGMVTRIVATFDLVGRYVWHCHILEHEDNEMMRPYDVVPAAP
jgi:FtsP/CotA-like multicopper oxidase with cupredoxin domain